MLFPFFWGLLTDDIVIFFLAIIYFFEMIERLIIVKFVFVYVFVL